MTSVLISGAGIAGPVLARSLSRQGWDVTVVERSGGTRSSGAPVDVRGPAIAVAERMGVMPALRAAATTATRLTFVDADGRGKGGMRISKDSREVELPRGDLAQILYEAARDDAEFLFGDTVTGLTQDGGGVDVTFGKAPPRRFGLVIGADGLHSTVRRIAFGPEERFVQHAGVFIATLPLPEWDGDPAEVVMFNSPGRALAIHPSRGKALALFMFRAPMPSSFDHRDIPRHKRTLQDAFAGQGWLIPQTLSLVRETPDLYFDSVSRVRLPSWSDGRIALLGDAASCVSLFGDGSSSAMIGAGTLASQLAALPHAEAFARYERLHRRIVDPKQRNIFVASALMLPASRAGIAIRNFGSRVLARS